MDEELRVYLEGMEARLMARMNDQHERLLFPERPRLMSADKARDIALGHKSMAALYESAGDRAGQRREQEASLWWRAYSLALAQTKGE